MFLGLDERLTDCRYRTPLDSYYENYFTAKEDDCMAELLPVFEAYDVFDHWNCSYIHLVVFGCANVDLSTYLTMTPDPIDVQDSWGRTALMWAAWRGDTNSVSILLSLGANPQAKSYDGNSVLIYAIYGGSLECISRLLGTDADINHNSHSLATRAMPDLGLENNKAMLSYRCEQAAVIEAYRDQNVTPLYVAALNNNVESLKVLLDRGASVNFERWNCSTPLSRAIFFNNHAMVRELIGRGTSLKWACSSYLRTAAVFGDERMLCLLMNAKPAIDISLTDKQNCTAKDTLYQRLQIMGASTSAALRLEAAFRELEEVCKNEYEMAK